jgi:hypothetical protein
VSPQDGAGLINKMINELSAGDIMIFHSGVYIGPFTLNGVNGLPNIPIVITGISKGIETADIDGKSEPGMGLHNNAFQLKDSGSGFAGLISLLQLMFPIRQLNNVMCLVEISPFSR